jgi:hypothetical protein
MVGDKESHGDFMQFGSGRLLKDVVTYARMSRPGRQKDHLTKLLLRWRPRTVTPRWGEYIACLIRCLFK